MPDKEIRLRWYWTVCLSVLFLGVAVFSATLFAGTEAPLTLAEGGKTDYIIVLPNNPTPVQRSAADELASVLKEISGADFRIETETANSVNPAKKQLVIGPSVTSRILLDGKVNEDSLEYDAIVIKRTGNTIVFSGHPKRGMLYAVDSFLEDVLGCRWWTAAESFIPKLDPVTVSDFDTVYAPKLISRESLYTGIIGSENFRHAVHLKYNGNHNDIPEEYGGHHSYLFFVHSFYALISPLEFEEHPDWFPEIDGVRKVGFHEISGPPAGYHEMCARLQPEQIYPAGTQLCLTNEELFQEMLKRTLSVIKEHPEATIISISQNDWDGYCECEKCRAVADEEESQSGPLLRFVNRMAGEIEKVYPDILVDTISYCYTKKPPKITHARENVIVRLCTMGCSFIQPLANGEQNDWFRNDMTGWGEKANRIFIWDYVTNFELYLLPFPNYRVWADNINFFTEHHAVGIFEQGDGGTTTGDFVQMRAWVIGKLLWNPKLDQRELMKEFIAGYYAPELVPIYLDYFDLLSDRFEATGKPLGIFRTTAQDWIDLKTLVEATKLLDQAEKTAEKLESNHPEKYAGLHFKVRRERIPLDLVWLMGYDQYKQEAKLAGMEDFPSVTQMNTLAEDFVGRLEQSRVCRHSEHTSAEGYRLFKENLINKFSMQPKTAPVPEICRNLPYDRWIDLQASEFLPTEPDKLTFPEDDPKASDGKAVRIPSFHHEWSVKYDLNLLSTAFRYGLHSPHAYISVRAESGEGKELPEGELFQAGVYSYRNNCEQIGIRNISSLDLIRDDYTLIDLGEIPCDPDQVLWVAPIQRTENPVNIYFDRAVVTF